MRIAVAMVSGFSTGWPRTMGAAPAAWKPHILRTAGGTFEALILHEAAPVGRDVARVPDRDAQQVGRVAEVIDDLEGGGLLPLDAVRVHGVDQGDARPLGQILRDAQRIVERTVDGDDLGAVSDRLRELAGGDAAGRDDDVGPQPMACRVGGGRGGGIAGGGAEQRGGAILDRLGDRHHHPAILKGAGGVRVLQLEVERLEAQLGTNDARTHQRRPAFAERDQWCVPQ